MISWFRSGAVTKLNVRYMSIHGWFGKKSWADVAQMIRFDMLLHL